MTTQPKQIQVTDVVIGVGLLVALALVFVFAPAQGMRPMEVVFVLDEGSGLANSAPAVKKNWIRIARSLKEQGFDCRFAVVPSYSDSKQIPKVEWTSDPAELEKALTEFSSDDADGWPTTDPLKALEDVLQLKFRANTSRVVLITTNNVVNDPDRLESLADKFKNRQITTIVQARENEQDRFRALYKNGGQFFTLAGVDKTEESVKKNATQTANIGSLMSLGSGSAKAEMTMAGVRVRGKIALVCDVSGSMSRDFPPLVRELRTKFPKDTPLILVVGCYFAEPDPSRQTPVTLQASRQSPLVLGVDLSQDKHVFVSTNTTDAIIMAVKHFGRDTVMFNNDLQDGGSRRALAELENVWKSHRFTLSGRSLNCDAPADLKALIKKTGGDFKMGLINRPASRAVKWRR